MSYTSSSISYGGKWWEEGRGSCLLCAKNSGGMGTHNLQEMCKDK